MEETEIPNPYKLTDEVKVRLLELVAEGYRPSLAAKMLGIGRTTYYRHINAFPEFKEQVEQAEEWSIDCVEHALYEQAKEGDVKAATFILINRRPARWADIKNVRVEGDVQERVTYKIKLCAEDPKNNTQEPSLDKE